MEEWLNVDKTMGKQRGARRRMNEWMKERKRNELEEVTNTNGFSNI